MRHNKANLERLLAAWQKHEEIIIAYFLKWRAAIFLKA